MRDRFRDFPLTVEEVRSIMRKEEAKRATWIAVGVSVIAVLVALVLWVAKRRETDLEEHYEYFDEDFDELDEDFDKFDDSIYDDEEEEIEFVIIKDFMYEDTASEEVQEEVGEKEAEGSKNEEVSEEK